MGTKFFVFRVVSADSDIGLLLVRSVLAAGMAPRKLSQRASASERYAIVLQLAVQLAALLAVASTCECFPFHVATQESSGVQQRIYRPNWLTFLLFAFSLLVDLPNGALRQK